MTETKATLRRTEIRAILGRHRGSKGEIARQFGVRAQSVSTWLGGRTKSARIARAAEKKALELLEQEQREKEAA